METNTFFASLLMNASLQLSTQAIANHQTASHLMDLSFIEKAVKMDIAESFAAQGLAQANLPRDAVGANLANQTPNGGGKSNG